MLSANGVELKVSPAAMRYLAEEGYDPEFGARPVKRAIHRLVLNRLSKDILAQKVDKDRPIVIDVHGEDLIFRRRRLSIALRMAVVAARSITRSRDPGK